MPAVDKKPWPAPSDMAIHIHLCVGIDLFGFSAEIIRMRVIVEPPTWDLPLSFWDTNPSGSSRALMVEIKIVDEDTAIFAWDGRTFAYRARFEQALILRVEDNLRVLPEDMRDFTVPANCENVLGIFGSLVLRDLVCCVRVAGRFLPFESDGAVAALLAILKAKPHLCFGAF